MKYHNKRFGFTLAEVLITLGVIGVVAALTLPSVMSNYQKKLIAKQLEKTYADLENLIKSSEVDNGSFEEWDYSLPARDFTEKYFMPYIQLTPCDSHTPVGRCFQTVNHTWYRTYGALETSGAILLSPKYILKDGRSICIYVYQAMYNTQMLKYVWFIVDVNGPRGKSELGKDVFYFTLYNYTYGKKHRGLKLGDIYTAYGGYTIPSDELLDCMESKYHWGANCGLLIQRNGWEVPDNYPIKF